VLFGGKSAHAPISGWRRLALMALESEHVAHAMMIALMVAGAAIGPAIAQVVKQEPALGALKPASACLWMMALAGPEKSKRLLAAIMSKSEAGVKRSANGAAFRG
jgi:hypothetical protein